MKKFNIYLSALLLSFTVASGAQATTLQDLFNGVAGGTITDGGDVFGNFSLVAAPTIMGANITAPDYSKIIVSATGTGGLLFAAHSQLQATGDVNGWSALDLFFAFSVTGNQINSASLGITASGITSTGDSGAWVTEQVGATLASVSTVGPIATDASIMSDLAGGIISNPTGTAAFAAQNTVWVSKNILVWSDGSNIASLDTFTQQFSQVSAPEPNELLLLAVGLMGFAASVKRRKSV